MLLNDEGDEIVGDLTLFERLVRRRIGGQTEVLAELNSEDERVEALDRLLGVKLNEVERNGIKRACTDIVKRS